jgi:hypothetical protein
MRSTVGRTRLAAERTRRKGQSNPRPLKVMTCFALPAASQKWVSNSFSVQGTNTAFSSRTCEAPPCGAWKNTAA